MARTIYEVAPHGDHRWHVRRRGTHQLDSIHNYKADAVARARRLCRTGQPSQLVIRRRNKTIQIVRTYGDDSCSPEGPFPPWD
jgi:hypothetical protein